MDYMATTFIGQIEMKARKEGREQAYKEAYDKVKQEVYQEKTNMVINMLKENCEDKFIHTITQLPLEEIAQIRKANS